jgi:hypothetical protein
MREWNLTAADPLALRLAADVRAGPTDYANDHIWELSLAGGDPPGLSVRTSYGRRVHEMRLALVFAEPGLAGADTPAPAAEPTVRAFYVNYIRAALEPLPGLEVTADFWVPDSHTLAGQVTLHNTGAQPRAIAFHLAVQLVPLTEGRPLAGTPLAILSGAALLEGQAANLDVEVLLEGPAEVAAAPNPRLVRTVEVLPGEPMSIRWVQAALPVPAERPPAPVRGEAPPLDHRSAGLEHIREVLGREWDGELARIELLNAGLLDIETGDPAWDAALALGQTVALRCYVGPTPHLPQPSFVLCRLPDRGYSGRGDGSDYNLQWNGQVATAAYVNLPQVVTAAPELAKGIVRNWLAVQAEDGSIDWKPGLAGQRERTLCTPLLATLAWRLYEHTEDAGFLAEVYPGLRRFVDVWFAARHDRDEDGVPEWTHTVQSAFDDNPSFVRWQPWGQGADIAAVEAPDLASYLYRECVSLAAIADRLGEPADPALAARVSHLAQRVSQMWRDDTASYHYVDRDSHEITAGEVLAEGQGDLVADLHRRFAPSARILVKVVGAAEVRPEVEVSLHGRGRRGRHRVEMLARSRVQWFFGISTAVSDKLYALLERVEVRGVPPEAHVTVSVVDTTRQDQTLLLPLWAGLPDAARAETLVARTLLDPARYWRAYGMPNCSALDPAFRPDNRGGSGGVWLAWNTMLGEGLVRYGYRAQAAELVGRLIAAMLHTLRTDHAFREAYNCDHPEGLGERDYIWGVAPVALFMQVLGVRIISPRRVYLEGRNPFPWPVTVRHKGLVVARKQERTTVTFPSGRVASVTADDAQFVEDG